ncbi:MAG: chemotaxis protein CheW [Polyangiaceae bacterium]
MSALVRAAGGSTEVRHRGPEEPAPADAGATLLCVVFRVGASEYALPAETVLQMESFEGATPVPGAPPFIVGVVQVRGRILPVLDLRLRFGVPVGEPSLENRIVVGQVGERVVALLVDSAREVLVIPRAELKPPPAMLDGSGRGFVQALAQLGPRLVMLLDFARIIEEEDPHGV